MLTIVHTESSMGWGGQEIRILTEALHLSVRGYRVIIGCSRESQLYVRALRAGLPVIPIPFKRAMDPQAVWHVYRVLKRERVEILNTHSSVDSWVASFAGRLAGVAIVRTRHLSVPLKRNPMARLVYSRLCDRIVTMGEAIRQLLIREAGVEPSKVVSIPTGVNLEQFDPLRRDGHVIRKELGIAEDIPLIGMVTVLRSWKGHRIFLQAIPLVLKAVPSARFLIVGDGPQRENIQGWVEGMGLNEVVMMVGHREDIPELLAALDIVVLSSTAAEGVPQALVQALAMQRPVVATDVGGVGELIRDGETGLLIPPHDPQALARSVIKLLRDRGLSKELACRGRQLVQRHYSLELMLERLEALYQELLGAGLFPLGRGIVRELTRR